MTLIYIIISFVAGTVFGIFFLGFFSYSNRKENMNNFTTQEVEE